jgi:hypothetical protein
VPKSRDEEVSKLHIFCDENYEDQVFNELEMLSDTAKI